MPDYREGQTATAKDGRQVIYKGGNWISHSPQGADQSGSPQSRQRDPVLFRQAANGLAKDQAAADSAAQNLKYLKEFDSINNSLHPTGGIINRVSNTVRGWMGNTDMSRFNALSSNMALGQRRPNSGPQSDKDLVVQKGIVGGLDKSFESNRQFLAEQRDLNQTVVDKHNFRERYLKREGSLLGATEAYAAQPRVSPPSTRAGAAGWTIKRIR